MNTWTGLVMSAGLPSCFGMAASSPATGLLREDKASAVMPMDERAKARRVMLGCFMNSGWFRVVVGFVIENQIG
jgi:hypothetical protein